MNVIKDIAQYELGSLIELRRSEEPLFYILLNKDESGNGVTENKEVGERLGGSIQVLNCANNEIFWIGINFFNTWDWKIVVRG